MGPLARIWDENGIQRRAVLINEILGKIVAQAFQHEAAGIGIIFPREETGNMRPMLEERTLGEKLVEPGGLISAYAAEKHHVGTARDDMDGIDLQDSHTPDGSENILARGGVIGRGEQVLGFQQEQARGRQAEGGKGHRRLHGE